ncbi:TauD/TfdA dioxygenase family protein [Tsuneonella sp. HG222]
MVWRATRLHPRFFAEITGVDLSTEPTRELRDFIERAMTSYAVCVMRQGPISDEQQLRFARLFGTLELPPGYPDRRSERMAPELFFAGNLDAEGHIKVVPRHRNIAAAAELFHADSSFQQRGSKWSMLRGVECPPPEVGGDTLFVDLRAVYDDLPDALKARLDPLVGIHDFWEARRRAGHVGDAATRQAMQLPPVRHRLVRTMPNGRKTLFIGGHCTGIEGMDEAEGTALLQELYERATSREYVHRHSWIIGDIVIWENRCALHAATPLNTTTHRRDMRRATVLEDAY